MTESAGVDVLAVGAHPDDVELGIGGLLHKLVRLKYTVAILDLTRGELSTRGTVEKRHEEAAAAAERLGVTRRENVGLHDGKVSNIHEQQLRVIPFIRIFRPKILLSLMARDRHPDHDAAHSLVRDAVYYSGLVRIDTGQAPYRPRHLYFYYPYSESGTQPQLIIDISDDFEDKLEALRKYRSQFYTPESEEPDTYVSSAGFWENIRIRAAYWGSRIGVDYGEPLYMDGPAGLAVPPGLEEK
jgi:bacillithiol biosynthesis deacetylase BshB1